MCDTFVALSDATVDGSVLFGKNSDREPNEAQRVIIFPAADHPTGSMIQCTHLTIPQASHTHAVLLCQPYWMWGAEMGANEHGVVIGNEAIYTRMPIQKEAGLLGMDLLRLGLERGTDASEALDVITRLLEQYGQGGSNSATHPVYYHNSFIIADPTSAWVLETAGKEWAAQKVVGTRSISNAITIGSEWERSSTGLVGEAVQRKWCRNETSFDFARCYSDFLYTNLSSARARQKKSSFVLEENVKRADPETFFQLLRDHGTGNGTDWSPAAPILGLTICNHAGFGPVRYSQTTGSLVAHLSPQGNTFWVTGTSAPCTSIFKPVWLDSGYPQDPVPLTNRYRPENRWWRHEVLHREIIRNYATRAALISNERNRMEQDFIRQAATCLHGSVDERRAFSQQCFQVADAAEQRWLENVRLTPEDHREPIYYRLAWKKLNTSASLPD